MGNLTYHTRVFETSLAAGATGTSSKLEPSMRGMVAVEIAPVNPAHAVEVIAQGSLNGSDWYNLVPAGEAGPEVVVPGIYRYVALPAFIRFLNDATSQGPVKISGAF